MNSIWAHKYGREKGVLCARVNSASDPQWCGKWLMGWSKAV